MNSVGGLSMMPLGSSFGLRILSNKKHEYVSIEVDIAVGAPGNWPPHSFEKQPAFLFSNICRTTAGVPR